MPYYVLSQQFYSINNQTLEWARSWYKKFSYSIYIQVLTLNKNENSLNQTAFYFLEKD